MPHKEDTTAAPAISNKMERPIRPASTIPIQNWMRLKIMKVSASSELIVLALSRSLLALMIPRIQQISP
jgi:hypothetical protein